jgi:nicotinate-nucleotide pyrophosphorylase (carboxylating)
MPARRAKLPRRDELLRLIDAALAEDIGPGDITTRALIDAKWRATGSLVAREAGILAGMPVVRLLLRRFDRRLRLTHALEDGVRLRRGRLIARIRGPAASMLTVERTLLNFLQYLSGIATETRRYVDAVAGTGARILDTRKTVPGLRALAKYAVAVGGGLNHRMGLYDQVLVKDNHLAVLRRVDASPSEAVLLIKGRLAPAQWPRRGMEVEVNTVEDACDAALFTEIVMLDNMRPAEMREAVKSIRAVRRGTIIEASGGVTLRNVRRVAQTGVDWISVGALTHSAPALDIAMDVETP